MMNFPVVQNSHESRRNGSYWATPSSVCSFTRIAYLFTRTAHLFACSALLASSATIACLPTCSLCSLLSW